MDERMKIDFVYPFLQLLLCRELAVQDQVGDFKVRALLGKLLDRVAAVTEDAFVSVDKGDLLLHNAVFMNAGS